MGGINQGSLGVQKLQPLPAPFSISFVIRFTYRFDVCPTLFSLSQSHSTPAAVAAVHHTSLRPRRARPAGLVLVRHLRLR